jgi:hypothetical protein
MNYYNDTLNNYEKIISSKYKNINIIKINTDYVSSVFKPEKSIIHILNKNTNEFIIFNEFI